MPILRQCENCGAEFETYPSRVGRFCSKECNSGTGSRGGLCRVHKAEFFAYNNAKERCNRKSNSHYSRYGGRGIEFRFKSFKEFFEYIGPRPSALHQLDREDNDGHYERGNVRWATREQNALNRGNNRLITYKGITKPLTQWTNDEGLDRNLIRHRLDYGWSVEDAFEKPIDLICRQNALGSKRPTSQGDKLPKQ